MNQDQINITIAIISALGGLPGFFQLAQLLLSETIALKVTRTEEYDQQHDYMIERYMVYNASRIPITVFYNSFYKYEKSFMGIKIPLLTKVIIADPHEGDICHVEIRAQARKDFFLQPPDTLGPSSRFSPIFMQLYLNGSNNKPIWVKVD